MSELPRHDRPHVTLEQLLALKRSERPDPTFWEGFDRELHRRQLASVVSRPAWYVRFRRSMFVGLRRAAPVAVAGAAAVAGFLALQQRGSENERSVATAVTEKAAPVAMTAVSDHTPAVAAIPVARQPESPAPTAAFERPVTGETRFVVHEFVAAATPTRTFVSVSSPNSFSSPAYDASLQMVNALTTGSYNTAGVSTDAGRF